MSKVVYVVICFWLGSYPKISGCFSSNKLAEEYVIEMKDEEGYTYAIEEFEVDILCQK